MVSYESLHVYTSKEARLFRRRFRMPYPAFVKLVKIVKDRKWFAERVRDVAGRKCISVELKVTHSNPSLHEKI